MRCTAALLLLLLPGLAQPPAEKDLWKLAAQYLAAGEADLIALAAELAKAPPLDKKVAAHWIKTVQKLMRSEGPRLDAKGTGYFYDAQEKKGKYIVAGGGNRNGLVIGLHGGGEGAADCTSAASTFGGPIQSAGMIGIFPEAIEATEAAWGDDVTVRFVLDLIAAAHRTFRFDPDRVYVIGHSMGGYGAWTWGGRFSDLLAGCASFAGGPTPVWDGDRRIVGIQDGVLPSYFNLPLWAYHSDDDPRVPIDVPRFAVAALRKLKQEHPGGFDFVYEEVTRRGHAMPARGATPALQWLAKRKRDPAPRKFLWQAFYERPGQRYWLAWSRPRRGEQLVAAWDGKASFDVAGDAGAEHLALLLNDDMVDLDQPVTLSIAGAKVKEAIPERRLLTLLESARARRDPGLLFTARMPFKDP